MSRSKCILSSVLIVLIVSCGPPQPADEGSYTRYPHDAKVDVNDGSMVVSWEVAGQGLINGYNIFIERQPINGDLKNLTPHNHPLYAGDTDPSDGVEHYEAPGLQNGVDYFVAVVVVYPDGSYSRSTRPLQVVCGPRRDIELQFRFTGSQDGFSLNRNDYVNSDDVANDFYFYAKDGVDYLASPSRLDGFLRATKMQVIHSGDDLHEAQKQLAKIEQRPGQNRVPINEGDWIWLITPEGGHALIQVLGFEGEERDRVVRLFVAYTPTASDSHM